MERITLRLPEQQVQAIEQLVETGVFPNRSEAIRTAVRGLTADTETRQPDPATEAVNARRRLRTECDGLV